MMIGNSNTENTETFAKAPIDLDKFSGNIYAAKGEEC